MMQESKKTTLELVKIELDKMQSKRLGLLRLVHETVESIHRLTLIYNILQDLEKKNDSK